MGHSLSIDMLNSQRQVPRYGHEVFRADGSPARAEPPLVYLAGSLKNRDIVNIHKSIEKETGFKCFSSWMATSPDADDHWREYEMSRGLDMIEALQEPAARNVFNFDKKWIDASDMMVMVTPCGKSAHMELGYVIGKGKPAFILMEDANPDRWDVMYGFATAIAPSLSVLNLMLKNAL